MEALPDRHFIAAVGWLISLGLALPAASDDGRLAEQSGVVPLVLAAPHDAAPAFQVSHAPAVDGGEDRLWVISTRHLCQNACAADLTDPTFKVYRLNLCGHLHRSSTDSYLASRRPERPTVIYVHGNRMRSSDAIERGLFVYRQVARRPSVRLPVDWVIWSWPSEKEGILLRDVRKKARRTDSQGLYLAWLLREHARAGQPTALLGYSFGARIVSGALHALAGGSLRRRTLPGEEVIGAGFDVGMIAPAFENDWMSRRGYHRLATQNLDELSILYNRRDAVLANYWRLERVRSAAALGYTGPRSFAPRADGSPLPVRSRDCGSVVGFRHNEFDYYERPCSAGAEMSRLVTGAMVLDQSPVLGP